MPVSFGYGVGDFIASGTLAWTIYKSCKGAPDSFGDISLEVLSLHAVLKEAEETVFAQHLSPTKQERLKAVADGCYCVLKDLDNLVKKYQSLGTQGKRTWDRMRWGTEDLKELRARLTSNTGLLTAWISMSQANVEKKLEEYSQEFKEGKRQGSVISNRTLDSLCVDEKQLWRTIRKELEDIGITVTAFDANKTFIFEWIAKAVSRGAFEEQSPNGSTTPAPCVGSSAKKVKVVETASRRPVGPEARHREAAVPQGSLSSPPRMDSIDGGAVLSNEEAMGNRLSVPLPQRIPRIPRVAALITRFSRPNKSLITAVEEKNFSKACEILNDESQVVRLDRVSFYRAMRCAANRGQEQVVRLLLEKGADVNAAGKDGVTALHAASGNGHERVVRLLLGNGADVNAGAGNYGGTALRVASRNGHKQVVQLLLEKGADINAGKYGNIVLQDEQVAQVFLGKDADVNARAGNYNGTALRAASKNGHLQIVELLLEKGADIDAGGGNTALHAASRNGQDQVVRLLLEKGANVDAGGGTALHAASGNGHKHIVRLLLKNDADVNIGAGRHMGTALQAASGNGHKQVVRLLLESGADVNAVDKYGGTALRAASKHGHEQVVRLLLEDGVDVNTTNEYHNNALWAASVDGHEHVVQLLLEKGAKVNADGRSYKDTALQAVSRNGHKPWSTRTC